MKRLVVIVSMLNVPMLQAVPNYRDPKNIINAGAYWFFRIDDKKVALAREHSAMKEELLQRVQRDVANYASNVKPSETPDTQEAKAKEILAKGYQQLVKDLETPQEERVRIQIELISKDKLSQLLKQTPQDLFGKPEEVKRAMGAVKPSLADYQRRVAVETRYELLQKAFDALENNASLTKKEKKLLKQVKDHINEARESIIESEQLHV